MRAIEFENKVRRIISSIEAGNPAEDTLVELKSEWSKDTAKAARRLAGHVNAAKGEPIIWIFGVDEKARIVTGVKALEMEQWIKAVCKHFDGAAPGLITHVNIHIENKTVVALYFETFRAAPFVIKNPAGGYPEFEVPWRDGTRLRAAKREELLSILLPVVKVPKIQIFDTEATLETRSEEYSGNYLNQAKRTHVWTIKANLYITPQMNGRMFIPHKNCEIRFKTDGYPELRRMPVKFEPIGLSSTVKCSETELVVDGPGSVCLESQVNIPNPLSDQNKSLEGQAKLYVKIHASYSSNPVILEKKLRYVTEQSLLANFFSNGSRWMGLKMRFNLIESIWSNHLFILELLGE